MSGEKHHLIQSVSLSVGNEENKHTLLVAACVSVSLRSAACFILTVRQLRRIWALQTLTHTLRDIY